MLAVAGNLHRTGSRLVCAFARKFSREAPVQVRAVSTTPGSHGRNPQAAGLVIGDEILTGKIRDKNIPFLADFMFQRGIDLCRVEVVPDNMEVGARRANVWPCFANQVSHDGWNFLGRSCENASATCQIWSEKMVMLLRVVELDQHMTISPTMRLPPHSM